MENIDKGLTVPKWVLIVRPKIPQIHQFVCPSPKVWNFNETRLHWAYVRSPWLWVLKIRERLMQFIINVSSHFSLTFLVHFAKNELLLLHAYQEWIGFGFSHLNSQVFAWQIKIHIFLRAHIIKPTYILIVDQCLICTLNTTYFLFENIK